MYTGTLIADLFDAVERAEKAATPPAQPKTTPAGHPHPWDLIQQYQPETSEAK